MGDGDQIDSNLPAGAFSEWLRNMRSALRGEVDSEVPCDGCTACCTSSQFVSIGPDEADALAHIPRQLLFPAPRKPAGYVLLGYDRQGHCPMLRDGRCSIYEHRPRACRTYDCRIFAATGLEPDDAHGRVARRARRWRFDFPSELDRREYEAVQAAARYVQERDGGPPARTAVQAVESYERVNGDSIRRG